MNLSSSRAIGAVVGLALSLLGGGCGSMPSIQLPNMQYNQNRTFPDDAAAMYDASQAALEAMSYSVVRGSRADGKLEMASRVQPSATLRARQRRAVVTVVTLDSGDSEVRIAFWEVSEDESAAGTVTATNRLLRDGTIYDVFWERLNDQLTQQTAPQSPAEASPPSTPSPSGAP